MCPLPRTISMVNGTNSMTPGLVKVTSDVVIIPKFTIIVTYLS